ncbi:MAG: hypothetical protein P4M14_11375 [Gammaproteobacteria bacterium]|nr:hypothetical protein [Gammaproteobacteria bacterium]
MNRNLYQHAECFFPWNLQSIVFNTTIFPYWTSESLYYFQQSAETTSLIKIDIVTGKKEKIFNLKELMDNFSRKIQTKITSNQLPLDKFSIQ